MFKLTLYIGILTICFWETNAYKILVVSPLPGKSHAILGEALVEHLANAGHEITYVAAYIPTKLPPKVTIVDLSDNIKYFPADAMNIKAVLDKTTIGNDLMSFVPMLTNMSRYTLEHPNVQKLINDNSQHFDVVIAEWMFSEIYSGFAGIFNCPLIWVSTVPPHWMVLNLIDEMPNPAYTVDTLSDSVPPLSFKERVTQLAIQTVGRLAQIFWISSIEQEQYETYFVPAMRKRLSAVPSLETLRNNVSLILSNSHVSLSSAVRVPPSFIAIGGYHIKADVKPLPEDLKKIMDNAKHGVIYFSMGSNLRSKHFPDEVKQALLKVFGKLKQTVLWKFEEDLPNRPSNVHILQWAPQQSILDHKNCKLFITHGGLLSTTETIHFGVPTIGIPVFADQFVNVARSVKKGYAKKVDLSYNMAADLEEAIADILNNPSYAAKAAELSVIYHDRPVSPARELVHWVEHVAKTRGALHLRSPAFIVPWYQKFYLDLGLVVLAAVLILKYVYSCLISSTRRKEKVN